MEHFDDLVVKNHHKVLSPLEVKEGMTIYSLLGDLPFKVHNRWLVLEIDDSNESLGPQAFCVLLYGYRAYTPGHTKWLKLSNLKRSEWRMFC